MKTNLRLYLDAGLGDLERMWVHKPMRLAILGILAIPLVYSLIYLSAFYDPYDNLKYLPVAVVNEDQGTVKDGERIHVGKDLVQELQEDSKVRWDIVSRTQMQKGFREGSYYMGIVIPRDFSQRAVSADQPHPVKGELIYYADEANNYLSGKLGQSVKRELENSLEESLTRVFAEKIFAELGKSAADLQKAADGAEKLADSTGFAASRLGDVQGGLSKIEGGANQVQSGHRQLIQGLTQMRDEMVKARQKMNEPLRQVREARKRVHQINDAIQRLAQAPTPSLDLSRIEENADAGLMSVKRSQEEVEASRLAAESLLDGHPELAHDSNFQRLRKSLEEASARADQSQRHLAKNRDDLLKAGRQALAVAKHREKIAQESQRMTNLFDQKAAELERVVHGADQLIAGANRLLQGAEQLEEGQGKLITGIRKLETGAAKLQDGLDKIAAGQSELAHGLMDGVKQAHDNLRGSDSKADMIADPVRVKDQNLHPVPNYAVGFAPYFISLSLWVGAMLLFTIVDLYGVLKDKPGKEPLSLLAGMLIGVGQAVICASALSFALELNPKLPVHYVFFTILMSLTFIAINQMLVALLGNVGRFVSIVILMLQLTSSGGTYPVELLPKFFQTLHPYLPMTYSVHGLRAILSSGNGETVIRDAEILLACMIAAAIVTQLFFHWMKPRLQRLAPKLKAA